MYCLCETFLKANVPTVEPMAEIKSKHWTKKSNGSSCSKLAVNANLTHGLIAQLVRAFKQNSVHMGPNPTQANFL